MVSALACKFLEGPRIGLGTFGNFRREKPKMFRSCRNRRCCFSLIKITTPEMFRIMPRIILEGTGNVLGPSGIFQKKVSRKTSCLSTRGQAHESGVTCLVVFCLGSTHVSRRHVCGLLGPTWEGQGCVQPRGCLHGVPLVPHLSYHFTLHVGHAAWVFWYFLHHPNPCLGL